MVRTILPYGIIAMFCFLGAPNAPDTLPHSSAKYRTAKRVYDDLVRVIGDPRTPPRFEIQPYDSRGNLVVAWIDFIDRRIVIEERVYDLCMSVGEDSLGALAVLLGHELAHFYKDHFWGGDFGNAFADLEVGRTVRRADTSLDQVVAFESQADEFGGLAGYLAGYNTLGIAPKVLEEIYKSYDLPTRLEGYPSLEDRKAIAVRSEERLEELIPLFDAARYLFILRKYEEAGMLFDEIARAFPSREILNNAGVVRALAALEMSSHKEIRFAYPIELDAVTRLRKPRSRGNDTATLYQRTALLAEASRKLEEARHRDPAYVPALVNLACVYDLQGDRDLAVAFASKAADLAGLQKDSNGVALALIARGIARANLGQTELALSDFESANSNHAVLATLNISKLRSGQAFPSGVRREQRRGDSPLPKQIGGLTPKQARTVSGPTRSVCLPLRNCGSREYVTGALRRSLQVEVKAGKGWEGMVIHLDRSRVFLLSTPSGHGGEMVRDVRLHDHAADVRRRYGDPTFEVSDTKRTSLVFSKDGVIVHVGLDQTIIGWTLFEIVGP